MRSSGVAGGIRLWARSELRRRWAALILLGVLTGLAAGLATAAIDGAGRTGTAYDRMRIQMHGADAVFFPSQVGFSDADVTKLGQIPQVVAWGGFATTESQFDEFPGGGGPLVAVGDGWYQGIERAKVLEGRLPNPARDDEALMNVPLVKEGGKVGRTLTWRNLSPADVAGWTDGEPENFDWSTSTGPLTKLKIVGLVRQPMESVMSFAASPSLWVGPGWARKHLSQSAVGFVNAFVRLRHGAADVPAFEKAVARIYHRDDIPVKNLAEDAKRVQRSLDVARTALLLFATAVIVATAVLIGQAFLRSVRSCAEGASALSALGLDRRDLAAGLVVPHLAAIAVAAVTTVVTAVLVSTRFPIGLARKLDPDIDALIGWRPLLVGAAITVAAALAVCGLVAWRTAALVTGRRRLRGTRLIGVATRAGASVPAALGTSMALEPAPSRTGATARPALIAAVVGILGVVGAVTLVHGLDDVQDRPERVGRTWDIELSLFAPPDQLDGFLNHATAELKARKDVNAFALVSRVATFVDHKGDVPLYSLQSLGGSMRFAVLDGRAPDGDDEIALGPETASILGTHIGDTIPVGPSSHRAKIVGSVLLVQTPHTSFDEGALLTPRGLAAATAKSDPQQTDRSLLIRATKGASVTKLARSVSSLGYDDGVYEPPDVANLAGVRYLPLFLAGFLILLAVGAIAHALLTGARSRSRELASFRALGLTPRQSAASVIWQATVIGAIALVIGVPLGTVVGRQIWRALARSLSFVYVGPLAGLVLVLIVPVTLAVVGLLALWPARAAARLRTAEVLRAE